MMIPDFKLKNVIQESDWVKTASTWIKHLYYIKEENPRSYQTTVLAHKESTEEQKEDILTKDREQFLKDIGK